MKKRADKVGNNNIVVTTIIVKFEYYKTIFTAISKGLSILLRFYSFLPINQLKQSFVKTLRKKINKVKKGIFKKILNIYNNQFL